MQIWFSQIGMSGEVQSAEGEHSTGIHVPSESHVLPVSQPCISPSPSAMHWSDEVQHDSGLCFVHAIKPNKPRTTSERMNLPIACSPPGLREIEFTSQG